MRKRTAIKILSFSVAFCLVFSGFFIKERLANSRLRLQITNGYSRNLNDFHAGIDNISLLLNKARFATDAEQISSMAAKLLSEAEICKTALSSLPQSQELTVLNRFLSQVGNFALVVSKNLISGKEISQADYDNLSLLSETAQKITDVVKNTEITSQNLQLWATQLDAQMTSAIGDNGFSGYLDEIEGSLTDFPTLIYDGPFSDHILEKEPEMLKGKPVFSEKEAKEKASFYTDLNVADLRLDAVTEGFIPAFRFVGEGVSVAISRQGGYCVYMEKERTVAQKSLTTEQARNRAREFLMNKGFINFKETYYFESDNICVVNFAYLDGETLCYTDLVKIGVAMDNGQTVFFEGSGYLANHKDRAFETPLHSPEAAAALLSPALNLSKTSIALIPTNSGGEVRCYELVCTTEQEQEIIVYINLLTLKQEDILILLKSDNGILVK